MDHCGYEEGLEDCLSGAVTDLVFAVGGSSGSLAAARSDE
jgi:hypothetical protein